MSLSLIYASLPSFGYAFADGSTFRVKWPCAANTHHQSAGGSHYAAAQQIEGLCNSRGQTKMKQDACTTIINAVILIEREMPKSAAKPLVRRRAGLSSLDPRLGELACMSWGVRLLVSKIRRLAEPAQKFLLCGDVFPAGIGRGIIVRCLTVLFQFKCTFQGTVCRLLNMLMLVWEVTASHSTGAPPWSSWRCGS